MKACVTGILFILSFILSSNAQTRSGCLPYDDSSIVYTEIVNVDSFDILNLGKNAKLFFSNAADEYNATVHQSVHKLTDYIIQLESQFILSTAEMRKGINIL